jgi:hypothetical protein
VPRISVLTLAKDTQINVAWLKKNYPAAYGEIKAHINGEWKLVDVRKGVTQLPSGTPIVILQDTEGVQIILVCIMKSHIHLV